MKRVCATAKKVLDILTADLDTHDPGNGDGPGFGNRRYGDFGKAIEPCCVEHIGHLKGYPLFSVAHYWKQNGDLMRDPDVVFMKDAGGEYYPTSFRQDGGLPVNEEYAYVDKHCQVVYPYPARQAGTATFCKSWMSNIENTYDLDNPLVDSVKGIEDES